MERSGSPPTSDNLSDVKQGQGLFFAVERPMFVQACKLGINPAVAYLLLASGTGRDNRTTRWSVNAVENRTSISRSRAREAIESLIERGLLRRLLGGKFPIYQLLPWQDQSNISDESGETTKPDCIWLPNALVAGATGETPILERVRQTRDPMVLRLLADCYHRQDLVEDGGISRAIVQKMFHRQEIGTSGRFTIWGFASTGTCEAQLTDLAQPHIDGAATKKEKTCWAPFWSRIKDLERVGAFEWVPLLFEGADPDAEIVHPLGLGGSDSIEDRIGLAAHQAGLALLPEEKRRLIQDDNLQLVPVPRHIGDVQLFGVVRLRYRPQTRYTSAWYQDVMSKCEYHIGQYEQILASAGNKRKQCVAKPSQARSRRA